MLALKVLKYSVHLFHLFHRSVKRIPQIRLRQIPTRVSIARLYRVDCAMRQWSVVQCTRREAFVLYRSLLWQYIAVIWIISPKSGPGLLSQRRPLASSGNLEMIWGQLTTTALVHLPSYDLPSVSPWLPQSYGFDARYSPLQPGVVSSPGFS